MTIHIAFQSGVEKSINKLVIDSPDIEDPRWVAKWHSNTRTTHALQLLPESFEKRIKKRANKGLPMRWKLNKEKIDKESPFVHLDARHALSSI
ncbi:MAG: hypothetical protein VYE76_08885 [Pseudomonadota bacterium]|nr:hypothetical protein [Pseudomonadota bacterium]